MTRQQSTDERALRRLVRRATRRRCWELLELLLNDLGELFTEEERLKGTS